MLVKLTVGVSMGWIAGGTLPRCGCILARLFLDLALNVVAGEWAAHAENTGVCVRGTGFGKNSVPVVGNRSFVRTVLLCVGAVAAFVRTASLLTFLFPTRLCVELPAIVGLHWEPVVVVFDLSGTLLRIVVFFLFVS